MTEGNRPGNGGIGDVFSRMVMKQRVHSDVFGDDRIVFPAAEPITAYLTISKELLEDYDDLWNPKHGCQTHEEARKSAYYRVTGSACDVSYQEQKVRRAKKKLKKLRRRLAEAQQALIDFDEQYPMEE